MIIKTFTFDAPYVYHITGKLNRRQMERVIVGDRKSYTIREVTPEDAPVCARFEVTQAYNFVSLYAADQKTVDVRYCNGKFYRRRMTPVEDLNGLALVDYQEFGADLAGAHVEYAVFGMAKDCPDFSGETFSDKAEILEALDVAASKMLIIGGELWQQTPEPALLFEEDLNRHKAVYAGPCFPDTVKFSRQESHFLFDLGDSSFIEEFHAIREADTGEKLELNINGTVKLLMPSVFGRTIFSNDIIRHAREFLEEAGKVSLKDVPLRYSTAWVALAKAIEGAQNALSDTSIEEVIEAWKLMDYLHRVETNCDDASQSVVKSLSTMYLDGDISLNTIPKTAAPKL